MGVAEEVVLFFEKVVEVVMVIVPLFVRALPRLPEPLTVFSDARNTPSP